MAKPATAAHKTKRKLIVLSGPSGVGKTTICSHIIASRPDVKYSISVTSRPKRNGEKDGREYFFISKEKFRSWIKEERFIEYARVHNNYYGTLRRQLEADLLQGFHVLMDIDVKGAQTIMQHYPYPEGVYIFIVPPDIAELERRLLKRNTDQKEVIKHRLKTALEELRYKDDYKYLIENRTLETTIERIMQIIRQEVGDIS